MDLRKMDLDIAKHIGRDLTVTNIWYIGNVEQFDEFCNYARTNFPNLTKLRVNRPVDKISPYITIRLEYLDCSDTNIDNLDHAGNLIYLDAANTNIKLQHVFEKIKNLHYLKIGHIPDRITIDSQKEYSEYMEYWKSNGETFVKNIE